MSSQKTTNYDLNQWLPDDAVLRTDFNADNAKIDAALQALADTAAGKADAGELAALSDTVAGHTTQLNGKGNCQIYYTTYVGNGTGSRTFTFSRAPLLVMVIHDSICLWGIQGSTYGMSMHTLGTGTYITFTWSGTSVTWDVSGSEYACNDNGETYHMLVLLEK